MRIVHPTTRNAARSEWGRRHNGLIVSAPFWAAGLVWLAHHVVAGDGTASSSTATTAKHAATQTANGGEGGLPLLAILMVAVLAMLLAAGVVLARSRRGGRTLERDVDLLESGGARWGGGSNDERDYDADEDRGSNADRDSSDEGTRRTG
jgi:hypothetical protein